MNNVLKSFLFFLFLTLNTYAANSDNSFDNKNILFNNDVEHDVNYIEEPDLQAPNNNLILSKTGLNLIDILNLALKNNPKVRESWTNVDTSKYSYRAELSNFLPTIKGELSYDRNKIKYRDSDTSTDKTKTMTPSVTLSYLLFDFGGREADVLNFKYKLKAVGYETNDYIQSFIYDVINAYYTLFSAVANESAAREIENSSYEAYKAASLRYKIGLVPLTDKLQAKTSYMQKRLNREKLENTTKIDKANLTYLLNISPTDKVELSIPGLRIKENLIQENINDLIKLALENRQDLKKYYETQKAKKAELYSARVDRLPSISFKGTYSHLNDLEENSNNDRNLYNIGVTATMPFFTGGYIYNNVAQTKSELKAVNYQIEDLKKSIEVDVWTAYQNFLTAERTHKTSEALLQSASETAKNILGKYKNGKSSILDLLSAQSDLASARYDFIESQHNWFINRSDLLRSVGKMNLDELKNLDK